MLESLAAVVVDLATFGLAVLGGYVAINPPERGELALKRLYVCGFIALGLFGITANVYQRHVDELRRTQSQSDLNNAQHSFSDDLKSVERKSDTILSFVTNPPKGISLEQATAFAKALSPRQPESTRLQSLPNERVSDMARVLAANLDEMANTWLARSHNDYMSITDSPCYGTPYTPEGCKAAEAKWEARKKEIDGSFQSDMKTLVGQANECRKEILSRLMPPKTNFPEDHATNDLYEKMATDSRNISPDSLQKAGLYLDNLRKRLP